MLNFPNPSRVYDASRHGVCFWGYDNSREVAFLVDDKMLKKLNPDILEDELALLAAFDRNRVQILEFARNVYNGGTQSRYTIS
ncbi:DUF1488 domain-containing protein [Paraburkholderia fynbosensis]|uniref:DUF1488 domain-containing protein n=1 Tax=Paraburkholderia fynbosensis TaxID=1200993 RepID=A0A6J5G8A8_9BURK|nr:DUF1488 domain-containing protein [Paraburkholderia fynbosensis]CAB3793576.1 hypothetical protein LMG27177_03469 [Paraburkholderia fynbosensis]